MQDTIINFYSTSDDYGDFLTLPHGPSRLTGKLAHLRTLFSGTKFLDEKYREEIRRVSSPMVAARMGRDRSKPLRKTGSRSKNR